MSIKRFNKDIKDANSISILNCTRIAELDFKNELIVTTSIHNCRRKKSSVLTFDDSNVKSLKFSLMTSKFSARIKQSFVSSHSSLKKIGR